MKRTTHVVDRQLHFRPRISAELDFVGPRAARLGLDIMSVSCATGRKKQRLESSVSALATNVHASVQCAVQCSDAFGEWDICMRLSRGTWSQARRAAVLVENVQKTASLLSRTPTENDMRFFACTPFNIVQYQGEG